MKAILMAAFLLMVVPLLVFPADQRGTPGTGDPQIQREIATLREGLQKLKIETANEIGSLRQMTQTSFSGVSTHLAAVNLFFGIAAGWTMCSSKGSGRASNTKTYISRPTTQLPRSERALARGLIDITGSGATRGLTTGPRMRFTGARCPGRGTQCEPGRRTT